MSKEEKALRLLVKRLRRSCNDSHRYLQLGDFSAHCGFIESKWIREAEKVLGIKSKPIGKYHD